MNALTKLCLLAAASITIWSCGKEGDDEGGKDLGTSILPNTYISWRNHKVTLSLPQGRHTLEMSCKEDSQSKINWLRIHNI